MARVLRYKAEILTAQAQYAAAERLYTRALSINEKAFGPDHPVVAQNLESMAKVYRKMDQVKTAEPLEERAEKIRASKR